VYVHGFSVLHNFYFFLLALCLPSSLLPFRNAFCWLIAMGFRLSFHSTSYAHVVGLLLRAQASLLPEPSLAVFFRLALCMPSLLLLLRKASFWSIALGFRLLLSTSYAHVVGLLLLAQASLLPEPSLAVLWLRQCQFVVFLELHVCSQSAPISP